MPEAGRKRARDWGIRPGSMCPGPLNGITDVPGVRVGHVTVCRGGGSDRPVYRTGVTAVLPHGDDVFTHKVTAAVHVINAFGKSVGIEQIRELGVIETPILLTGTLNVWRAADAMVDVLVDRNPDTYSFSPVVAECNDSYLNDAVGRPVGADEVRRALAEADDGPVAEGCVGAGTGMSGFGYKAGIGTASRRVEFDDVRCTLGVLALTNTGKSGDLRVDGVRVPTVTPTPGEASGPGSIIMVLATDARVSARQLGRIARRAAFGLARTGAYASHQSGDYAFALTTWRPAGAEPLPDARLDPFFLAAVEATEEAVVNSIFMATTTDGRDGHVRYAIPDEVIDDVVRRSRRRTADPCRD